MVKKFGVKLLIACIALAVGLFASQLGKTGSISQDLLHGYHIFLRPTFEIYFVLCTILFAIFLTLLDERSVEERNDDGGLR